MGPKFVLSYVVHLPADATYLILGPRVCGGLINRVRTLLDYVAPVKAHVVAAGNPRVTYPKL